MDDYIFDSPVMDSSRLVRAASQLTQEQLEEIRRWLAQAHEAWLPHAPNSLEEEFFNRDRS